MSTFGKNSIVMILIVAASVSSASVYAGSPLVRWERIEGISPNATGQVFNGISPVTFPWSTTRGGALLNLHNGKLNFHLEGLSMGASPTPFALIGTTGVVTEIKGTIMCHQSGEFVDSDAVELSDEGDAQFSGQLTSVPYCEPGDLIFLIRIAAVRPDAPPISDRWLGHGAARKILQRARSLN